VDPTGGTACAVALGKLNLEWKGEMAARAPMDPIASSVLQQFERPNTRERFEAYAGEGLRVCCTKPFSTKSIEFPRYHHGYGQLYMRSQGMGASSLPWLLHQIPVTNSIQFSLVTV